MPAFASIAPDKFSRLIGTVKTPLIIDVRVDEALAAKQLDAGILPYDALYKWTRDATAETHNWPATGGKATR